MSLIKRSGGKVDLTKVDLSLKGILFLVLALAVLIGAYAGGKWVLAKGKAVTQGILPDSTGTGDIERQLGI